MKPSPPTPSRLGAPVRRWPRPASACRRLGLCGWLFLLAWPPAVRGAGAEFDQFEREIRPLLVERCYSCHSVEAGKAKGGLLLDSRAGWERGGDSGKPIVVPGHPERSLLIQAVHQVSDDLKMPPKGKLREDQIHALQVWVASGAPDPRSATTPAPATNGQGTPHWAFRKPVRPAVPAVRAERFVATPVDSFVLARLERAGLAPAPRADARTRVRRLAYDLTGLPPTSAEVRRLELDDSPATYAALVENYIESPRFGERWARHWLDVARYSDTKGYVYSDREEARFVHGHVYRDWVIRALNEDLPYDRFLALQLAADLLSGTNQVAGVAPPELAAMGYLTLGRRFLGVVHDIIDDRIDTVMRGMQGLTVACARCHDHKYDPIPTREYYGLYGVFQGTFEQASPVGPAHASEAGAMFRRGLEERTRKLETTFAQKRDELLERLRLQTANYLSAVLDVRNLPTEGFYEIRGPDDLNPVVVRQWAAYLGPNGAAPRPVFGLWQAAQALPPRDWAAGLARLLEPQSELGVNPLLLASVRSSAPTTPRALAQVYGGLFTELEQRHRALRSQGTTPAWTAAEQELLDVLHAPSSPIQVPAGSIVDLEWFFDEGARVAIAKAQMEIDRWIIENPGAAPHAVHLIDRAVQRPAHVFIRGNPANRGEPAPRAFLAALGGPALFSQGSGRAELAQAVIHRDNPLTARVWVNRVWAWLFGAGLVRTTSDFGLRAEPPSHPELLDWMAVEFMDRGWSTKQLIRVMVLSSTYQQSSHGSHSAIDPENRLLSRMNRKRLEFEALRDTLLVAGDDLDLRMGGRPEDLFGRRGSQRRTVYGLVDRQFLPPVFRVFDFANPDLHIPERPSTTVPQQALFLLNNRFILNQALSHEPPAPGHPAAAMAPAIRRVYDTLLQRPPSVRELELAKTFLAEPDPPAAGRPLPSEPSAWSYGYAGFDPVTGDLDRFEPLPSFVNGAWQGGAEWPDPKLGWARLTADGGHPGNDLDHAAVRRWTAPSNTTVRIEGSIVHSAEPGDGFRATIRSSRGGRLAEWTVHNRTQQTRIGPVTVPAGETIDFVADIHKNLNNDQFSWSISIQVVPAPSNTIVAVAPPPRDDWSSNRDFSGPPDLQPAALDRWHRYVQTLLWSNEVMFVD